MFMARTRSLVRMTVDLWRQWRADTILPGPLLEAVNRELCQNNDERMFVTLFLGLFDTQTGVLSFVNAGHPAPHLLRAGGNTAQIDAKPALPLGVRRHAKYEGRTLAIQPGDALFVCSDGVFEALNEKGDLFSIERLNQELTVANGQDPVEIVRVIKSAVDASGRIVAWAFDHDPSLALWSGQDGLDAIRVIEATAWRLLKPGGVVGVEHADAQGESAPAVFAGADGHGWADIVDNPDLAGRPRFVTARRP